MNSSGNGVWRRQMWAAFTLIELLVVISIISVLAALLMPALEQARQAAFKVECIAQIRQLNLGIHMYANQWGGVVPCSGCPDWTIDERILDQIGAQSSLDNPHGQESLLKCPQRGNLNDWTLNNLKSGNTMTHNGSYRTAVGCVGGYETTDLLCMSDLRGARTITYADAMEKIGAGIGGTHSPALRHMTRFGVLLDHYGNGPGLPPWGQGLYDGVANFGFLDGHVESLGEMEILAAHYNDDIDF